MLESKLFILYTFVNTYEVSYHKTFNDKNNIVLNYNN